MLLVSEWIFLSFFTYITIIVIVMEQPLQPMNVMPNREAEWTRVNVQCVAKVVVGHVVDVTKLLIDERRQLCVVSTDQRVALLLPRVIHVAQRPVVARSHVKVDMRHHVRADVAGERGSIRRRVES